MKFAAFLVAAILSLSGTALAGGNLPPGSYRDSCSNAVMNGGTLTANCRNAQGSYVAASLPGAVYCGGEIQNDDGRLQCVRVPNGSYRETCKNVVVQGAHLAAVCRTASGEWRSTALDDYYACGGAIDNADGRLRCGSGGGGTPPGSYRDSCNDVTVNGSTLRARCATAQGVYVAASLRDYFDCGGEIQNNDGRLQCANVPNGSYRETCKNVVVHGDRVTATCRTATGAWQQTKLDHVSGCASDIRNDNGNLVCRRY